MAEKNKSTKKDAPEEEKSNTVEDNTTKSEVKKINIFDANEEVEEKLANKEDVPEEVESEVKSETEDTEGAKGPEDSDNPTEEDSEESIEQTENQDEVELESTEQEGVEDEPQEQSDQIDVDDDSSDTESEPEQEEQPDGELDKEQTIEEALKSSEEGSDSSDSDLDNVVDEIVREESDEILEKSDEVSFAPESAKKDKSSFGRKLLSFFKLLWVKKPIRYGLILVLFLAATTVILVPNTRYAALNLFGVRVSTSMTIVDSQTRLPLKNISVSIQDQEVLTTADGYASFEGLKLGESELAITKLGYADNVRNITLGWGSNPKGEQELVATGERFTFMVKDWKSQKPIQNSEALTTENSALGDESGNITITVGEEDFSNVEIFIAAEGYRTEVFRAEDIFGQETEVLMVPSKKHYFVSNRDGDYDLYRIDLDGNNEELVLAATGDEREIPSAFVNPFRETVAFISSRDADKNDDGFALDGLFIFDRGSKEPKKITRSEQLQVVGWFGNRLVYSQVVEGTSRGNGERSKLFSYDVQTEERIELAAANYFNDVELVDDVVYYAVSSFAVPQSLANLYSIKVDGTEKTEILNTQVWTIYRKNYTTLVFNAISQKWYEMPIGGEPEESEKQILSSRSYAESTGGGLSSWVDVRDGKGSLYYINTSNPEDEKQVVSQPGLNSALYWTNDSTIVYRVISNSETADYVIGIDEDDPTPTKITDITATQRFSY